MRTGTRLIWSAVTGVVGVAAVVGTAALTHDIDRDDAFVIDGYERDVRVQPDGWLLVEERLDVTFSASRRGIVRELEGSAPGDRLAGYEIVSVDQGRDDAPWPWTQEWAESGDPEIRIGDPDVFLDPGPQRYRLRYGVDRLAFRPAARPDRVQIRLDVPGDGWPTDVASTLLRLELPAEPLSVTCVQGRGGQIDPCPDPVVDGIRVEQSVGPLTPLTTATIAIELPDDAFDVDLPIVDVTELTTRGTLLPRFEVPAVPAALLMLLFMALPALLLEWLRSRLVYRDRITDPALHDRVTPTAELEPPDGARPVELSSLLQRMPGHDLVLATILDLELRGVLATTTTADEKTPVITVTRGAGGPTRPWEAEFVEALLGADGRREFDGEYDKATAKHATRARSVLTKHGNWLLGRKSPLIHQSGRWLRGGAFVGWVLFAMLVGAVLGTVVTIVTGLFPVVPAIAAVVLGLLWLGVSLLWRRHRLPLTSEGRDVLARTQAFRHFLAEVHADRLEFAAGQERYDQTHPALALLPYAMALGLADSWYARFEPLLTELARSGRTPSGGADPWYVHRSTFGAVGSSYAASVTSPSSSSGSGSFGGGGAGSGGGGGGGRSW